MFIERNLRMQNQSKIHRFEADPAQSQEPVTCLSSQPSHKDLSATLPPCSLPGLSSWYSNFLKALWVLPLLHMFINSKTGRKGD